MRVSFTRRTLLAAPLAAPWIGCLEGEETGILDLPAVPADARIAYGPDRSQFADIRVPRGPGPHPVAIVIHGGYWKAAYNLDHIGHLCAALTAAGVATWSLEYRRLGNAGGGWPGTFDDIRAGAAHLATVAAAHGLDMSRVMAAGHSAGGQLALWLAAERAIPLRRVVSLAGVADLRLAWQLRLSGGIAARLLGGTPEEVPERYRAASPIERLPIAVPQTLLHGTGDDTVPFEMSKRFAQTSKNAKLIPLPGAGHFELIDPRSKEWDAVRGGVMAQS